MQKVVQTIKQVEIKTELPPPEPKPQLDTRFFGELLAEVYRKNCDIHSVISEQVAKMRGRWAHFLNLTSEPADIMSPLRS